MDLKNETEFQKCRLTWYCQCWHAQRLTELQFNYSSNSGSVSPTLLSTKNELHKPFPAPAPSNCVTISDKVQLPECSSWQTMQQPSSCSYALVAYVARLKAMTDSPAIELNTLMAKAITLCQIPVV